MRRSALILICMFPALNNLQAQIPKFSLATDLGLQRSFKKEQQFWSFGHTVQGQFHVDPKDAVYAWLSYYKQGSFSNQLTATAKSILTNPQLVNYTNNASMSFKEVSIGWKKYLKGTYNTDKWNIYSYAGFGLVFGNVSNVHSVSIDTGLYKVPVRSGSARFKRLTADLGLGYEIHLGASIYFYNEARVWIPTSDYPSKYIFVNSHAPLVGMFNVGIRVLFD
jgi:hypothetical protein